MAAPPRDSNQLQEHVIRMTTHPKDRFWTTVNLEANMNKIPDRDPDADLKALVDWILAAK
jgi:hypothetical protein